MNYYVLKYSDYTDRPDKLFCDHQNQEGQSYDGLRFIVRCDIHEAGSGCLSWINGNEEKIDKEVLFGIITSSDWTGE